jgi:hypothetical protein
MSPPPPGPFVRTSYVSPFLMSTTETLQRQQMPRSTPQKSTPLTRLLERRASAKARELESLQSADVLSTNMYVY